MELYTTSSTPRNSEMILTLHWQAFSQGFPSYPIRIRIQSSKNYARLAARTGNTRVLHQEGHYLTRTTRNAAIGTLVISMARLFIPRKGAPKSRGGCLTCKIRRIKCDENKPHCLRCTTTGRKCDGYVDTVQSNTTPDAHLLGPSTTTVILTGLPGERLERRSFDFFRSCTLANIDLHFGSPPWARLLLQACDLEPALQHLAAAIGAIHEHLESKSHSENLGSIHKDINFDYAAQQYTKALTLLRNLLIKSDTRSIELALIGALMCMYYETLQENWEIAQLHLENSLNVLKSLLPRQGTWFTNAKMGKSKRFDNDIVQAFAHLDIEASCTLGHRHPAMCIAATVLDLPTPFTSISQAREFLYALTSQLHSFMRSTADDYKSKVLPIPLPVIAEASFLQTRLKDWESSFYAFLNNPSTKLTRQEQKGADVLSIQQKLSWMKAATCLYAEEMIFDRFDQDFEDILCLADYLIHKTNPPSTEDRCTSSTQKVVLTFNMGIIEALFWTAVKCRSRAIRSRAINILRKVSWQEGVWNAEMMAAVAERFVRMEEEGLEDLGWRVGANCKEARIPEWRRLHEHGWEMHLTGRQTVIRAGRRENGVDGEWSWFEEELIW